MTYDAAAPVFAALRDDLLPEFLRSKSPSDRRAAWPGWVHERDQAIRQRLKAGERDSIVNLLVFGTAQSGARVRWPPPASKIS